MVVNRLGVAAPNRVAKSSRNCSGFERYSGFCRSGIIKILRRVRDKRTSRWRYRKVSGKRLLREINWA